MAEPSTRQAILEHLKKAGEARAEGLGAQLGITVSAVRQHLASLAADGLVVHREAKGGPGRPKHVYRLSERAELLFPKMYGELTTELLEYVAAEDPSLLDRLFARRAERRYEQTVARLAGKPFAERVRELARVLDEDGYLAEMEALPDGTFRIVEHNCAILSVAQRFGHACSSEIDYLRAALPDAEIERVSHMMAGAHVCAYEIKERSRGHRRPARRPVPQRTRGRATR